MSLFVMLMEADPAKRVEFLMKKWGDKLAKVDSVLPDVSPDQIQAWMSPALPARQDKEYTEARVRSFINSVVNAVDPSRGGYSDWIIRSFLSMNSRAQGRFSEDAYKITEDLTNFSRFKQHLADPRWRDINFYRSFFDLASTLEEYLSHRILAAKKQDDYSAARKDVVQAASGDDWEIIIPKTWAASRAVAGHTRWCSASSTEHYFNQYNGQGPLNIIILRHEDPEGEYFQFHFASNQYMDAEDQSVDVADFCNKMISGDCCDALLKLADTQPGGMRFIALVAPETIADRVAGNIEAGTLAPGSILDDALIFCTFGQKYPEQANDIAQKNGVDWTIERGARSCGLYTHVSEYSDLIKFVAETKYGRKDYIEWLFDGSARDGFYNDISFSTGTVDYLDDETKDKVYNLLQNSAQNLGNGLRANDPEGYFDDLEYYGLSLTADNEFGISNLYQFLKKAGSSTADDVKNAMVRAEDDTYSDSLEAAYIKVATDCMEEALGGLEWNGSRLRVGPIDVGSVLKSINDHQSGGGVLHDSEAPMDGLLDTLASMWEADGVLESPNFDRVYGSVDEKDFNERLNDLLYEIGPEELEVEEEAVPETV